MLCAQGAVAMPLKCSATLLCPASDSYKAAVFPTLPLVSANQSTNHQEQPMKAYLQLSLTHAMNLAINLHCSCRVSAAVCAITVCQQC